MGIRERTRLVKRRKARRCHKCGGRLGRHQTRCHRCHERQAQPGK